MGAASTFLTPPPSLATGQYPPREYMQQLIDRAANFNLYVTPRRESAPGAVRTAGAVTGIQAVQNLHRFDIEMSTPSVTEGVRASNVVGPAAGQITFKLHVVPFDFVAAPNRIPPPAPLDPTVSQRIILLDMVFTFGGGTDGFIGFATGRTFPLMAGSKPQLSAAFIGTTMSGFGRFQGCEGNFTFCGELRRDEGVIGHIMVRIMDPSGKLRTDDELPLDGEPVDYPDADSTYLSYITQKRRDGEQENFVSFDPSGQMRGLNIPVDAQKVFVAFSTAGGFRARNLRTGSEAIGLEIGFGREPFPRTMRQGTPQQPFQFEGVSQYSFHDPKGNHVGAFTSNVVEGRSFRVVIAEAPDLPGLRFGFFGPAVDTNGSFTGAQGFLYGASGSIFAPPPFPHVISNWYGLRMIDPQRRFRVSPKRDAPQVPKKL